MNEFYDSKIRLSALGESLVELNQITIDKKISP